MLSFDNNHNNFAHFILLMNLLINLFDLEIDSISKINPEL